MSLEDSLAECARVFAVPAPAPGERWQGLARMLADIMLEQDYAVVGISGSQGSGKTTLARTLIAALNSERHTTVSLDDYYLSAQARRVLAGEVHPLLSTRGVPGTHDHRRLRDDLLSVRSGRALSTLPTFDKGRDEPGEDRQTQAERLVLEGWCLGVEAQREAHLQTPVNALEAEEDPAGRWRHWVNQQIADHYHGLWQCVDFWVHLRVPGFEQVLKWRTQAENELPAAQRMSETELVRFISHYERITRHLWATPPRGPGLVVQIDEHHALQKVTPLFRQGSVANP